MNRPSNLQTPVPQIYRHYNKIEIFNDEKLDQNQSISHKISSKSNLDKSTPSKKKLNNNNNYRA